MLEGEITQIVLAETPAPLVTQAFLEALALAIQPRTHLLSLYQGWLDTQIAYQVAGKTGHFELADSPEYAAARRQALRNYQELETQITVLRIQANKENQLARRVEINLALQRLQHELDSAFQKMAQPGPQPEKNTSQ